MYENVKRMFASNLPDTEQIFVSNLPYTSSCRKVCATHIAYEARLSESLQCKILTTFKCWRESKVIVLHMTFTKECSYFWCSSRVPEDHSWLFQSSIGIAILLRLRFYRNRVWASLISEWDGSFWESTGIVRIERNWTTAKEMESMCLWWR